MLRLFQLLIAVILLCGISLGCSGKSDNSAEIPDEVPPPKAGVKDKDRSTTTPPPLPPPPLK